MRYKQEMLAEVMGTFVLVFAGCGAVVVNDMHGGTLGHTGICLVFGLAVMTMIYAVGNISGAHFNPAVTLGFWMAGRINGSKGMFFILAQFGGAVTASLVLRAIFPGHATYGATLPGGTTIQTLVLEFLLSFILMFVILNVSTGHKEKGIMAGVAVGGTVLLAALFGGPVTGASMNPARSFGPALVSGHLGTVWPYLLAPVFGMVSASPSCRIIQGPLCCVIPAEEAYEG